MASQRSEPVLKGDVTPSDLEEIKEKITPHENLKLVASVSTRSGKGENITILTNQRLILLKKGDFKLFGRGEGLRDIPYALIERIDVDRKRKFDLLKVHLSDGDRDKFMLPKGTGEVITGDIRRLQTLKKRKETRGETPLKKLERLSNLRDREAITEKKFKEKKEELLKEI